MTGLRNRVFRAARVIGLVTGLGLLPGGCITLPGGQGAGGGAATNMLAGDAITATPLDPVTPAPAPAATIEAVAAVTAAAPASDITAPAPAAAEPAPEAVATGDATAETTAPEPPPPVAPVERKSEAHLACEKAGGIWSRTGSGVTSCISNTRDSGKRCTRAGQCEGACLARSGTCAPFRPLFGCNEILDESGRRMTECLQ